MSIYLTNPRPDSSYVVLSYINSNIAGNPAMFGTGGFAGIVRIARVPGVRRVEIRDSATQVLAGTTISAVDGTWEKTGFTRLRPFDIKIIGNPGENTVVIAGVYAT
jgi:hypothetical protein